MKLSSLPRAQNYVRYMKIGISLFLKLCICMNMHDHVAIYEGGVLKHNLNYFVYHWPNDFVYQKKNNQVRIAKHIYYM